MIFQIWKMWTLKNKSNNNSSSSNNNSNNKIRINNNYNQVFLLAVIKIMKNMRCIIQVINNRKNLQKREKIRNLVKILKEINNNPSQI